MKVCAVFSLLIHINVLKLVANVDADADALLQVPFLNEHINAVVSIIIMMHETSFLNLSQILVLSENGINLTYFSIMYRKRCARASPLPSGHWR